MGSFECPNHISHIPCGHMTMGAETFRDRGSLHGRFSAKSWVSTGATETGREKASPPGVWGGCGLKHSNPPKSWTWRVSWSWVVEQFLDPPTPSPPSARQMKKVRNLRRKPAANAFRTWSKIQETHIQRNLPHFGFLTMSFTRHDTIALYPLHNMNRFLLFSSQFWTFFITSTKKTQPPCPSRPLP